MAYAIAVSIIVDTERGGGGLHLEYTGKCTLLSGPKNFARLAGCGIKCMRLLFETKMSIDQSKANVDVKILFGKITHLLHQEIMIMLARQGEFQVSF